MKKALLVTAIAILGLANINAQNVVFGIKGGLNFASITGDNNLKDRTLTAFNFGAMAEISISKKLSFQPELIFSGQGYSTGSGVDDLVGLNYLNVPLIAKYYITKGLSIEAGPQIGFLLSDKQDDNNLIDAFKKTDFGINLGIGYKLDNGLNFGARYNLGLTNISNLDAVSNKNGVIQLSVGYFLF